MSCECSFFILQVNAYDGDLALAVDPHMDEELDRAMICPLCGVQLLSFVEVLQHNCFDACSCQDGVSLCGGFGGCGCDGHGLDDDLSIPASCPIVEVNDGQMDVMDNFLRVTLATPAGGTGDMLSRIDPFEEAQLQAAIAVTRREQATTVQITRQVLLKQKK